MESPRRPRTPRRVAAAGAGTAALALIAATLFGTGPFQRSSSTTPAAAARCAPGFQHVSVVYNEVRTELAREGYAADAARFDREVLAELPMLAGVPRDQWDRQCVRTKRPESLKELIALFGQRAVARMAPYGSWANGATSAGIAQRNAMQPGSLSGTSGKGAPYGQGPLIVNDPRYPEVNGLGLVHNSGRIDSFAWDPAANRLFAAVGSSGIWRSDNLAKTWTNATGNLPSYVTSSIAWTTANGGTLLTLTGESTFGAASYTGVGAYYSRDLGKTWARSAGIPDDALGFALAVDPANANKVYAATQLGLFASVDGGRTYKNANLPTGECSGVTDIDARPECALQSVVTDVVVAMPGGVNTTTKAGTVVATVGWRGGQKQNADGSVQSPNNGVYRSASGTPNTFTKLVTSGFAAQDAIGRTELGTTVGAAQDHDILYAIVQDANLLNKGGVAGIDIASGPTGTTVLNGIYVSKDFGLSWTKLASGTELALDPTTGSALHGYGTAVGYQPGVQGWYNLWLQPDPTRQTASGVPTRMAFGLEEMWANEHLVPVPLDGSVKPKFRVVGKYFAGESCQLLTLGLPHCPTDREPMDDNLTTHPDQHDGIWIPDPLVKGGVQLIVGNDGGAYRYRFDTDPDSELDNAHWDRGDNDGFYTLLPYYAAMAKDGTVWAGLQDNGNMRIDPVSRKQYETYGGDGFFTAVDPNNSKVSYEEYTNATMSVTTDGGTSWRDISPGVTASKFSNPFTMDPLDAKHLLTAGRQVVETLWGQDTAGGQGTAGTQWRKVFDLGTRLKPGNAAAVASAVDPDNSMSAVEVHGDAAYVGFCGHCDTLNKLGPGLKFFKNGLATNVGGAEPPQKGTAKGWHLAAAKGLPNRYITSIASDPANPRTVWVTVGGYTRRWLPPGAVGDENDQLGTGHLYRSTDAGETFVDMSGNLPDVPATWIEVRADQLLVGTDAGAFLSQPRQASGAPKFVPFMHLPPVPVSSITLKPGDHNTAVIALYGASVWTYEFDHKVVTPPDPPVAPEPTVGTVYKSFDFESATDGWTSVGFPTTWQRSSPGHKAGKDDPATQAFAVAGPLGYVDLMEADVTSPAFAVPAGKTVAQFALKLDTEGGYDTVTVEWSKDGSTWTKLATYSGRNDAWPDWNTKGLVFDAPGGNVQLRFHFHSDEICAGAGGPFCVRPEGWEGAHVDDVVVGSLAP
jgi:hypothetical protein